jgi:hypothetical protein
MSTKTSNIAAECRIILPHIREIPGSNLGSAIGYAEVFLAYLSTSSTSNEGKAASVNVLSNVLFADRPIIRHYKVLDTGKDVKEIINKKNI